MLRALRGLEGLASSTSCGAGLRCFATASAVRLLPANRFETPEDIVGEISPITRSLWFARHKLDHEVLETSRLPEPIDKEPHETAVTYAFSSDPVLREQYRNPWGHARIGRLLEDLDSLAGNVAFLHCDDEIPETRPPLLVTASVDRITLARRLTLDADLIMAGSVVWTGRSALDIRMQLRQDGCSDASLTALFTFVARDPVTRKSMAVNPLRPQTEEQRALFAERQRIADERRAARQQRATSAITSTGDAGWAGELVSEARAAIDLPVLAPSDAVLMRDTALQNTFICQPQQRNLRNRIFGGFLMRRAYELAFSSAYMFSGVRPVFLEVEEVSFRSPVSIGDLLRFQSHVAHTVRRHNDPTTGKVHVEVVASVMRPEMASSQVSNTFDFVFDITTARRLPDGSAGILKRVLPSSEEEAARTAKHKI